MWSKPGTELASFRNSTAIRVSGPAVGRGLARQPAPPAADWLANRRRPGRTASAPARLGTQGTARIMVTSGVFVSALTYAEAQQRARLIDVLGYHIDLDVTGGE